MTFQQESMMARQSSVFFNTLLFCGVLGISISQLVGQETKPRNDNAITQPQNSLQATATINKVTQESKSLETTKSDWTQWRGAKRDGFVSGKWPDRLSDGAVKKRWSVKLGPSYSGPIVVGERVFVTETFNRKTEIVTALDRKSGKVIWQTKWPGSMKVPLFAAKNGSWIRSTPAYDDGYLYIAGIRDMLVCLNAKDGKIVWKIDCTEKFGSPPPQFGCVCSPLIDGEYLYMQAAGALCKMKKKTGELVWKTLEDGGGMMGSAFSSPLITKVAGKHQVVVQTRESLAGVDLETGSQLWSKQIPTFRGMNILTPSNYKNGFFVSAYGGSTEFLEIEKTGSTFGVNQKWNIAGQAYMSTPVIVDGHAYLNMRNRTITCFDLNTGAKKWASPRYGEYASLVTNGKKILALDQTGLLLLFNANPDKFDLLDSIQVSDNSWAHVGFSRNQIFVRELNAMTVYDWSVSENPKVQSQEADKKK